MNEENYIAVTERKEIRAGEFSLSSNRETLKLQDGESIIVEVEEDCIIIKRIGSTEGKGHTVSTNGVKKGWRKISFVNRLGILKPGKYEIADESNEDEIIAYYTDLIES